MMARKYRHRWTVVALLLASGCARSSPSVETILSETCDMILDHLASMHIEAASEANGTSCLIEGTVPLAALDLEIDPLERLRNTLSDQGWSVVIGSMADGPGTSSYQIVREGLRCRVEGGAPAWVDDDEGIRQPDAYFVAIVCGPTG